MYRYTLVFCTNIYDDVYLWYNLCIYHYVSVLHECGNYAAKLWMKEVVEK